jgi:preprotein translocase subunit YajC
MHTAIAVPILASLVFLGANVTVLLLILVLNRQADSVPRRRAVEARNQRAESEQTDQGERSLAAADILGWEFKYARVTASEANAERHTMVNFYLLIAGVVAAGVLAVAGRETGLPRAAGTLLLWLLICIGWVYFLGIIRLRQAWQDSAKTMNQIKQFYIDHTREFSSDVLRGAFRWQAATLPAPDKPWTVYFYSTMLIGLLNTAAYVGGGALLALTITPSVPVLTVGSLVLLGLVFFAFHVWLYFAFLRPKKKPVAPGNGPADA